MKEVTPNPPPSTSHDTSQTPPNLIFTLRPGLSTEAALSNASEMLESATVCAYDCAEHLDGSGRKQVLAVVQMIEIAQLLVESDVSGGLTADEVSCGNWLVGSPHLCDGGLAAIDSVPDTPPSRASPAPTGDLHWIGERVSQA